MAYQNIRSYSLILIFFCLLCSFSARSDQGYFFKQISLNEGLTQSTARCILNDRKGFLWIGTKSGLNRFDRYSLKSYFHKQGDVKSIPGNEIAFIHEDVHGQIWVATENGLARYNSQTDDFTLIKIEDRPVIVNSALQLKEGMVFGGAGKIYKADLDGKRIVQLSIQTSEVLTDMFMSAKIWRNNLILLRTRRNGLWTFDVKRNQLKRADFVKEKEIMAIYVDQLKQIWVAPYGIGLKHYDQKGNLLGHYTTVNSGLNNDVVLDIIEHDQQFWIATDGGGINILNPKLGTFSALKNIPGNPSSLPEKSIVTLYQDRDQNLWAGSIRGGAIAVKKVFINTFRDAPLGSIYGLSEKTVLSIHQEKGGYLWIGTDGGGINRFDPKRQIFKHFPSTFSYKIASITEFSDQKLLISAFSKGLYVFDKASGSIAPFNPPVDQKATAIPTPGIATNVYKVNPSKIFLFTNQIQSYEISKGILHYINSTFTNNSRSSLLRFYSDELTTYFFSPYQIYKLDHQLDKITSVFKTDLLITAAARSKNGTIWLGTNNGLLIYDPQKKNLKRIESSLFKEISALIIDHQNRLWIASESMVFLYLIKENKFIAFGESDGVIPNEFLFKPSLVANDGDIYLGGVRGLVQIKGDIPIMPATVPEIELMGLELNGVPLAPEHGKNGYTAAIPWNHSSLIVKVITRKDDVFRKKMFRFQIKGLDFKNVETYSNALTIGSLPAGNYRILVSCTLKNGGWSTPVEVLSISVSQAWFKSLWFIALLGLCITAVVVWFYRMAILRRERKLQWEMKGLEQKTYEAKIRFLINISHELRTPLTLIYSPLQRLLSQKSTDKAVTEKLEGVYHQAKHMKDIIDMVLDVRKIELGQEKLELAVHDLHAWIIEIASPFLDEFEANRVTLSYAFDPSIKQLTFDRKKCEIILTNLLINALKFSLPDTTLTLKTGIHDQFIRISVIDEGIGLDHLNLNELFKPFYQGEHQEGGSGIGLSFSKVLIEIQGGKINAFNNNGAGATFYFELPIKAADEVHTVEQEILEDLSSTPLSAIATSFSTSIYTLLVVEDQSELRTFLKESLQPYFKSVIVAPDGLQALETMKIEAIDIVLSDVRMPGIDGFELCRQIKENIEVSHIPVVLLTTQGDAESRNLGYKLGADTYLSKPFEIDFLYTILSNLLKNREAVKLKYKSTSLFIRPETGTFSSADEVFMNKLNALIADNLEGEALHVDFLVDKMAMSRAALYSKLKSIADIGVNDYINKFRLEKAVFLLTETDHTIMEIADKVGFSNQRYFSTVFKQAHQTTPSLFREQHKAIRSKRT